MASKSTLCGACEHRHITKPAVVWCSECDEGLCTECREHHSVPKGTRDHRTIPIAEYQKLPADVLQISQYCRDHNEKYQMYCKKHDRPCCRRCITENHIECKDISVIDDVIAHAKTHFALEAIEEMLTEIADNINQIQNDRHKNQANITENKRQIEKEILQTRLKINSHLDKIQKTLIKELYEVEEKESKKIQQLMDALEGKKKDVARCQLTLANIKQHASDLQTFLAIKMMEKDVKENEKFVNSFYGSGNLSQVTVQCEFDTSLQNFKEIRKFGEISVKTDSTGLTMVRRRTGIHQMMVPSMSPKSIDHLILNLKWKININGKCTTGCCILPDGRIAFSDYSSEKGVIQVMNKDGSEDFEIKFQDSASFDITYIKEDNAIAVSSGAKQGYSRLINIVDSKRKTIKRKIPVEFDNYGIVAKNKTLYVIDRSGGIRKINLQNESVSYGVKIPMSVGAYVATFGEKLYYTNGDTHTVTCCDLQGTTLWQFKNESVLTCPRGISVDSYGNVYVVFWWSHNIVVISPDGKQHKQLLSEKYGLFFPYGVHCDRSNNELLVANEENTAFLFDVTRT